MIPAFRNDRPKAPPGSAKENGAKTPSSNSARPKIASTMSGVPAITSTADSTIRLSQRGRPYSTTQIAVMTPRGAAITQADHAEQQRPLDRVENPARKRLVDGWARSCDEQRRAQVVGALDDEEDHQRRRTEAQPCAGDP